MSFLTEGELEFYTGRTQMAAQVRVLQKWKIKHIVNAAGKVRVTWAQVNGIVDVDHGKQKIEPDFGALDRVG